MNCRVAPDSEVSSVFCPSASFTIDSGVSAYPAGTVTLFYDDAFCHIEFAVAQSQNSPKGTALYDCVAVFKRVGVIELGHDYYTSLSRAIAVFTVVEEGLRSRGLYRLCDIVIAHYRISVVEGEILIAKALYHSSLCIDDEKVALCVADLVFY